MNRPLRWTAFGLAVASLLGMTTQVVAQEREPRPGIFSEVVDVRVVNLEVVVTDKDGVPVVSLQPENFVLEVDGEVVPIQYFSEIRAGVAGPSVEGEGIANLPALVPGDPVETSYLVFVDEYFSIGRDRDKVLEALITDLPRLGPTDRMAIVAFNGQELEMLTTWSQSVSALERALEEALERDTHGLQRLAEQRQFNYEAALLASQGIRGGQLAIDRFLRTDLTPTERFYLERLTEQIQRSVSAAASALRTFAMPPGRKVMLLYSGGWPFFPISFMGNNLSPITLPGDLQTGSGLFRPLSDTANLLGYTIYPVDMPGFADVLANEAGGISEPGNAIGVDTAVVPSSTTGLLPEGNLGRTGFLRQQENHYSLRFLAAETGGRPLLDSARIEAFDQVVSDTRSYYWLGFSPQREWDDTRHEVRVRLKEGDFRIRSRGGFLDTSEDHEVAMSLESTLLFGNPAGVDSLGVLLGEPEKAGRGKMNVPVTVLVPLQEVTFLPSDGELVTDLQLRVAVLDDQGRRAEIPIVPVTIRVQEPPAPGVVGRYETFLRLRRTPHDVVVAIYDPASGRILSASAKIAPQSKGERSKSN